MSWGRQTIGTAAVVLATIAHWPEEVLAVDTNFQSAAGIRDGHQRQAKAAVAGITAMLENAPANRLYDVRCSGHATLDESGHVDIHVYEVVQPAEAAETASESVGESVSEVFAREAAKENPVEQDDVAPSASEGAE